MKKKIKIILVIGICCSFLFNMDIVSAKTSSALYLTTSYIACGNTSFPEPIANYARSAYLLIQIVAPLGIIVLGSLDFAKAVIASDAEKIKKTQNKFISKLIAGAVVFFVLAVVKLVVTIVADSSGDPSGVAACVDCLISDNSKCSTTSSPFN